MVTAGYLKVTPAVGIGAGLDIFDPCAVDAQWNFIFTFACGRTGMAANTFTVIDDEAIVPRLCGLINHVHDSTADALLKALLSGWIILMLLVY